MYINTVVLLNYDCEKCSLKFYEILTNGFVHNIYIFFLVGITRHLIYIMQKYQKVCNNPIKTLEYFH